MCVGLKSDRVCVPRDESKCKSRHSKFSSVFLKRYAYAHGYKSDPLRNIQTIDNRNIKFDPSFQILYTIFPGSINIFEILSQIYKRTK